MAVLILTACTLAYGGMSGRDVKDDPDSLEYEVTEAMEVQPDKAVFPFELRVSAADFTAAAASAHRIFTEMEQDLKKLDAARLSLSPADFRRDGSYGRKSDSFSLFKDDKRPVAMIQLDFLLTARLTGITDSWERINLTARAMDFLKNRAERFKKQEDTGFYYEYAGYDVENPQLYRDRIVQAIHANARGMADMTAGLEGRKAVMKTVEFGKDIRVKVVDMNRAFLSMDARMVFRLEDK